MSWDQAYKQLEVQFGREPTCREVQTRMLEIAQAQVKQQKRD